MPFQWLKKWWDKFDAWCATIAPGVKTKTAAALGAIAAWAASAQEWISGLPLGTFVTAEKVAICSGVLFTLAFWFRTMKN